MAVDLTQITSLTAQVSALRGQLPNVTDIGAKQLLEAQLGALETQLALEAQHQQAQLDASNSILNGLGLFATLTSVLGSTAPTIVQLFTKG